MMSFLDKVKKVSSSMASKPEVPPVSDEREDQKAKARTADVLEMLQIPATFEIPADVFLPEDLKDIHFDLQVPQGYDIGQVMRFLHQTRNSISFMTDLLKRRNADVAKLATTVDRLQVDLNNQRFDSEIANGISVMPTEDAADLENQLMEAKLTIRRLEDRLSAQPALPAGQNSEANTALLDELSLLKRRNQILEEENSHYKSQLAQLEEEADDEDFALPAPDLSRDELEDLGLTLGLPPEEDFYTPTANRTLPTPDSVGFDLLEEDSHMPSLTDMGLDNISLADLMGDDEVEKRS